MHYSTVLYSTVQYSTVQYSTVQYSTPHGGWEGCTVAVPLSQLTSKEEALL